MKRLISLIRRVKLGKKYKHQITCHPDFNLSRNSDYCSIFWNSDKIAEVKLVHTLKNTFKGSCFTIATGPSLKKLELKRSTTYDSISLNCAIRKFSGENLSPTHCIIVDHRVFENHWQCIKESILSGAYCYFSYVGLSRICEREPELLKHNNIYLIEGIGRRFGIARPSNKEFHSLYKNDSSIFLDSDFPLSRGTIGFSTNAEIGFFTGKTVATWAVQLANYLGYTNNFIVGMDLGGTGKTHFYDNGTNRPPDFLRDYEPYIRACFEQSQRASTKLGFQVYNLSKNSTLPHEIIPKISYDEAISLAANKELK